MVTAKKKTAGTFSPAVSIVSSTYKGEKETYKGAKKNYKGAKETYKGAEDNCKGAILCLSSLDHRLGLGLGFRVSAVFKVSQTTNSSCS